MGMMQRWYAVLVFLIFLAGAAVYAADESLSITTYYPAPYGVYRVLRISPSNLSDPCQEGQIYYNATERKLKVCNKGGNWDSPEGGGDKYWNYEFPPELYTFSPGTGGPLKVGNVAIGTTVPTIVNAQKGEDSYGYLEAEDIYTRCGSGDCTANWVTDRGPELADYESTGGERGKDCYWNETISNPNDIYNTNLGMVSLGIGPRAKLDIGQVGPFAIRDSTETDLFFVDSPGVMGNQIQNKGYVGIGVGTMSPWVRLDVIGNLKIRDGTQGNNYVLTADASGNAQWQSFTAPAPVPFSPVSGGLYGWCRFNSGATGINSLTGRSNKCDPSANPDYAPQYPAECTTATNGYSYAPSTTWHCGCPSADYTIKRIGDGLGGNLYSCYKN